MKKTIIFLMMIVSVFAIGSAFAADSIAAQVTNGMPYNGVTFFDLGLGSTSGNAAATEIAMLSNGITYFSQGQTESEAKGYSAAGALPDSSDAKPYNGVTVFNQGSL